MDEVLSQSSDANVAPVVEDSQQEKLLRQSEVNEIVGRVRQEEKSKRDELLRSHERAPRAESRQDNSNQSSSNINDDYIRQVIAEEANRYRQEAQSQADEQAAYRIVKNFHDKMETGKQKYDDFDKVTNELELRRFPNTVQMLAEHLDNAADVMYELSKNRSKLAQIEMTAEKFPQESLYELKRLSESIKKNEEVSNTRQSNAPLSQQRPSNVGTDSGSVLSMRDLKAKYRV